MRPGIALPAYNWLNDDEHGVKQTLATAFPNGPSLGAGFSVSTMTAIGRAIGTEARSLHNDLVNKSGFCCNGVGVTAYAPNMNLVHDPRCMTRTMRCARCAASIVSYRDCVQGDVHKKSMANVHI